MVIKNWEGELLWLLITQVRLMQSQTIKENACLVLLITDHLNWDNEFEHLKILQDKINAYVAFIESEQYDEIYPNADFKMAMIEIHFKYDVTDNCQKFLQVVQDQLGRIGIKIKAQIS